MGNVAYFSLYLGKGLSNISGMRLYDPKAVIRCNGAYVFGQPLNPTPVTSYSITKTGDIANIKYIIAGSDKYSNYVAAFETSFTVQFH